LTFAHKRNGCLVAVATAAKAAATTAATAFTTATTTATAAATTTTTVGATETAATAAAFTTTTTTVAAATTTTTTTTAVPTTATSAGRTWLHGTRLVDYQATATQRCSVHAFDSSKCFGIAAHFDETKTFGATGIALHHDFGAGNSTELSKRLFKIAVAYRIRQVADVQFVAHERDSLKHNKKAMESRTETNLSPNKQSFLITKTLRAHYGTHVEKKHKSFHVIRHKKGLVL
jgi:hypothetical protein